jgi:hypothetical protein
MRKHPECASVAEVAPLGILLAVLLALFAWSQLPHLMAAIVFAPLLLFFAAVLIVSMQISATHGFRSGWRAPAVFATIYLGQGIGLLYEYAFPSDAGKRRKVAPVATVTQATESLGEAERAA